MARKVDPEVLAGFIEEANGYLPQIRQGIDAFANRPTQSQSIEEAHRLAHNIRGTAQLVGLGGLATIAGQLEELLEELINSRALPRASEAAALLHRMTDQIGLYLESKAKGSVREKPLLEQAAQALQEFRALPTSDRYEVAEEITPDANATDSPTPNRLADRVHDLRGWLAEAALGQPGSMAALRQPFELLLADATRLGHTGTADALQRLCLLAEMWEGLAGEAPESAADIAVFAERALEYVAENLHLGRSEEELAWIVNESSERWGEYLALLDPGSLNFPAIDDAFAGEPAEESPAIDANSLLRMLTGAAPVEPAPLFVPQADDIEPIQEASTLDTAALLRLLTGGTQPHAAPAPPSFTPAPLAQSQPAPHFESAGVGQRAEEAASNELLEIFALEAEDHIRNLSTHLPVLEEQPDNKELLQDIRRSAHTLKGSASMVGFRGITKLAHRMEDLLDLLYEGSRAVDPEIVRLLYASTDALEDMVAGKPNAETVKELYALYDQLLGAVQEDEAPAEEKEERAVVPAPRKAREAKPEAPIRLAQAAASLESERDVIRRQSKVVRFPIERIDELVKLFGELVITRTFLEQRMAELVRQVGELDRSASRLRQASSRLETQYEASTLSGGGVPGPAGNRASRHASGAGNGNGNGNRFALPLSSHTHGFDDLEFDRYTEFHLLTRSLAETTSDIQTIAAELGTVIGDFDTNLNRQARLSSDIENKLMTSRMVPLSTLASRLRRTVRNVASEQRKRVDLVLEGEGTELDKTVLEQMADPLLHLLRNAVDHGIEAPELRLAIGKEACGTIRLRAHYAGSQVVIQVSDDGAGLDPQMLREIAVERAVFSAAEVARMSDEELLGLVFLPGFSTAREISEVSGRGVGLDVVKTNVHKLKGNLALESQVGKGTTFTIRLPVTMAVMRAILVKSHQESFAIPLGAVQQIARIERSDIEWVGQEQFVRVADRVYPLYSLGKVLGLKQPADESVTRWPVLILDVGAKQIAFTVDHLLGGREVVIKNLGNHLRRVRNLIGATLMGDGSVVLILDPMELVQEATSGSRAASRPPSQTHATPARDTWTVLIIDDSPSVRRVLSSLIKGAGWKPVTARDGLEALELLYHTAASPDLILLDVEMPRMDGYELLATLKANESYRNIPVVMVTSRAGDKHRRKALDLGSAGYLVKPYQDEALLKVIRALVKESRSRPVVHA
jgi:chemotaxis protein histidine kinase CheA/ActR/RegA family two-component response regulator